LDLKILSRYLSLTAGATLKRPFSGKKPSVINTWPWGLNPKKSPKGLDGDGSSWDGIFSGHARLKIEFQRFPDTAAEF
jgi:hypothetical protein